MKRILSGCLLLLLFTGPIVHADNGNQMIDRIVAVVNEGIILQSELEEEVELVREQLRQRDQRIPDEDVLRSRVLENLVTEQLQLQRARIFRINVDDEAVNQALNRMAREQGMDLSTMRNHFAEQGIEFSRVRADVREQLIISQLRQRSVASGITISEQEINDFMERLERQDDQEVEYRVQHILIGVAGDAPSEEAEAAEQEAHEVVARLRDGEDFADMAARISDGPRALEGGDLGWRGPADLPSLFAEAVGDLRTGEVSEPLRSPNGFHILRLAERRGGSVESFTEHRARHILIRDDQTEMDVPDDDDDGRARIMDLRQRILDGASFEELARAHSEDPGSARRGGDLGWFGPGEMTPVFEEVVQELPAGRLSEPFRSPFGWHIVEVLDTRERTDVERLQRAQAHQALYRQRMEEETQRWLRELRDEAFIEYRLDN